MAREYFCAYHSFLESLTPYSDAECGRLFRACLVYSRSGDEPELHGNERFIWPTLKQWIDRDRENYEAKCRTNRENGRMGANAPERPRTVPNAPQDKDKDKGKGKDKGEDNTSSATAERSNSARERFAPPSVEDVLSYCRERGNSVDAQKFVDFYASKGWKVGNQSMKDWKAAVRTWEQRDEKPAKKKNWWDNRSEKAWEGDDVERLERMLKKQKADA